MKRNKLLIGTAVFMCLIILFQLPGLADTYFRKVVKEVIEQQVEQRQDEINEQVRNNIQESLKDENTQQQVQDLMQQAVATELEQNGVAHLKRVIEQKAPHAVPLLFPEEATTKTTDAH